jgi:hypothetical protein
MANRDFIAVVLDLYDTIVRRNPEQLPLLDWRERQIRIRAHRLALLYEAK